MAKVTKHPDSGWKVGKRQTATREKARNVRRGKKK